MSGCQYSMATWRAGAGLRIYVHTGIHEYTGSCEEHQFEVRENQLTNSVMQLTGQRALLPLLPRKESYKILSFQLLKLLWNVTYEEAATI